MRRFRASRPRRSATRRSAPMAAAVGGIMGTLMITGGVHEGGLARTADALGGAAPGVRAVDIMESPERRQPRRAGDRDGRAAQGVAAGGDGRAVAGRGDGGAAGGPCAVAVLAAAAGQRHCHGWARRAPGKPRAERTDPRGLGVAAAWAVAALAIAWLAEGPGFATLALGRRGAGAAVDAAALRAPPARLAPTARWAPRNRFARSPSTWAQPSACGSVG